MARPLKVRSAALSAALVLGAALSTSPGAYATEAPVQVARVCAVNSSAADGFTVTARPGAGVCGKGTAVDFGYWQANQYLTEQLCDFKLPIGRYGVGEDMRVSCVLNGDVAEPSRDWRGRTLRINPVR